MIHFSIHPLIATIIILKIWYLLLVIKFRFLIEKVQDETDLFSYRYFILNERIDTSN